MEGLKEIKVDLGMFEEVEIIPVGDTHLGEEETDVSLIKGMIDYVLEKPNRFVILNGDIMDMALKDSVSDVYGSTLRPSEQLIVAGRLFKPLADAKRILAITDGNHEFRVRQRTNFDISYMLAKELGVEERYADNSYVLMISFGQSNRTRTDKIKQNVYSLFGWHGSGGGRKSGGKMNRVMDMAGTIDADIYLMSHVHDAMVKSQPFFRVDIQNRKLYKVYRYFMISNAWQSFGGYGQRFGFTPSSTDIVSIILNGRGKKRAKLIIGNNQF